MKKNIPIILAANNNYSVPLGITIFSILKNRTSDYNIEFFICNYDNKKNEYWLSNGSIVIYGNLDLLISCQIISSFVPNLQNKLISEYLIDIKKSIEYLPSNIKQKIKKYRKEIQWLHDIPNYFD